MTDTNRKKCRPSFREISAVGANCLVLASLIFFSNDALAQGRRSGFGGGGGGFNQDDFFKRLDTNEDGRWAGDEVRNARGPWAQWLTDAGIDIDKGVTKEEFGAIMERRRAEREANGGGGGPGGGGWGRDRRGQDSERPAAPTSPGGEKPATPSTDAAGQDSANHATPSATTTPDVKPKEEQKKKGPLLPTLDTTFASFDINRDQQISLVEWRKQPGKTVSQFLALDRNNDGFLSPKELKALLVTPSTSVAVVPPTSATSVVDQKTPGPNSAPAADKAAVAAVADKSTEAKSPEEQQAKNFLDLTDKDHDGTVTPEEWEKTSIKKTFEKAGYDVSKPMPAAEFVRLYAAIVKARNAAQ